MAKRINEQCVNCGPCDQICPNDAISPAAGQYVIDPEKCTECVGHYDAPRCMELCPAECVEQHPDYIETREELWAKFERLNAA